MTDLVIPKDCIVFDTETTGFSHDEGDRLVEIGAVRMRDGLPTNETFHRFINPGRSVPQAAVDVHGLTTAFLADKPLFEEVADDFVAFVGDLPMVAHNATFDERFINAQLQTVGLLPYPKSRFIDTLIIARQKFPGQQVSLDALCKKMKISLDARDKHGALIDSLLLAEVCVELMGGRQASMLDVMENARKDAVQASAATPAVRTRVLKATPEEREAHQALVARIGDNALWHKYLSAA